MKWQMDIDLLHSKVHCMYIMLTRNNAVSCSKAITLLLCLLHDPSMTGPFIDDVSQI